MKKNFSAAFRAVLLTLGFLAASLAGACRGPFAPPSVLSFGFRAGDNAAAGLAEDVWASIDHELGVITVRLPDTVADYSSLKAAVSLPEGSSALPSVPTDYSLSPTALVVANEDGLQSVYLVDVGQRAAPAPADAVLFTEYYAGTGYDLGGDRNRWIEITNKSAAIVDLAQYRLVKVARLNGQRVPSLDQDVALRGQLAAGASLVLYADMIKASRFLLSSTVLAPDLLYSDIGFNGIIDFNGDDGYQLTRNGVILDVLGPNGGTGADYYWGREKRMLRKSGTNPTATWNHLDWITYGLANNSSDAANAGAQTPALPTDRKVLTFFAFERLAEPSYGIIDEAAKTVSIAAPQGTDLSSVIVSVGVEGLGAWAQGETIVSGETALDLRTATEIWVYPTVGSTYQSYTVQAIISDPMEYTTTPYSFNGGIGALLSASIKYPEASFPMTVIEGVVTAKNVYYKYSSDADECFFIQDSSGGIMIWTDVGVDAPIGSRVRVEAIKGIRNYTMPIIYEHGKISRVDAQTYDIYYETDAYNNLSALGRVFRYTGVIEQGMADYDEGAFSVDAGLRFQGLPAIASLLETGDSGSFYGPIQVSYSKYKMCLSQEEQILP
ncbi:MAG: hypothetical protein JW923_06630 [Spirochaetales bacterium]|nr:hypothetical protein [Spirochaetales bacterium]